MLENPLRAALAETAARRQSAGLAPGPVWSALRRLTVAELLRPGAAGRTDLDGVLSAVCEAARAAARRRPGWFYAAWDEAPCLAVRANLLTAAICAALRGGAGAARRARRAAGRNPPRRCAAVVPGRRARARNTGRFGPGLHRRAAVPRYSARGRCSRLRSGCRVCLAARRLPRRLPHCCWTGIRCCTSFWGPGPPRRTAKNRPFAKNERVRNALLRKSF